MDSSIELLKQHIKMLEGVLASFSENNENAVLLLNDAKTNLSQTPFSVDDFTDIYKPAVYNALAVINTAPCQTKINRQLNDAVSDALNELCAILEYIS